MHMKICVYVYIYIYVAPVMNSEGEVIGLIRVVNKKNAKHFTDQDEKLLDMLCCHVQTFIEAMD